MLVLEGKFAVMQAGVKPPPVTPPRLLLGVVPPRIPSAAILRGSHSWP